MKLVVTETNWADEMDVWGFEVIANDEKYNLQLQAITEAIDHEKTLTLYVGSNEEIGFDENFMRHFKVTDIEQEDAEKLASIFGSLCKGNCLFDRLVETALDTLDQYNPVRSKKLSDLIYSI